MTTVSFTKTLLSRPSGAHLTTISFTTSVAPSLRYLPSQSTALGEVATRCSICEVSSGSPTPGFTRKTLVGVSLVRLCYGFGSFCVRFLLSWREESSTVKRAGNLCSLVCGSFLDADMLDVTGM